MEYSKDNKYYFLSINNSLYIILNIILYYKIFFMIDKLF